MVDMLVISVVERYFSSWIKVPYSSEEKLMRINYCSNYIHSLL